VKAKVTALKGVFNRKVYMAELLEGQFAGYRIKVEAVDENGLYEGRIEGAPYRRYGSRQAVNGNLYFEASVETDEMRFVPMLLIEAKGKIPADELEKMPAARRKMLTG
jgi:hypothetical protein